MCVELHLLSQLLVYDEHLRDAMLPWQSSGILVAFESCVVIFFFQLLKCPNERVGSQHGCSLVGVGLIE